jgi:hypothetical protein
VRTFKNAGLAAAGSQSHYQMSDAAAARLPEPLIRPRPARARCSMGNDKETELAKRKSNWREPARTPPLPVLYPNRADFSVEAHYEAVCRHAEERAQIDAILQMKTRMAATALGRPAECGWRVCRRARRCAGPVRLSDPFIHLGRIFPPCCDTPERAEEARAVARGAASV